MLKIQAAYIPMYRLPNAHFPHFLQHSPLLVHNICRWACKLCAKFLIVYRQLNYLGKLQILWLPNSLSKQEGKNSLVTLKFTCNCLVVAGPFLEIWWVTVRDSLNKSRTRRDKLDTDSRNSSRLSGLNVCRASREQMELLLRRSSESSCSSSCETSKDCIAIQNQVVDLMDYTPWWG